MKEKRRLSLKDGLFWIMVVFMVVTITMFYDIIYNEPQGVQYQYDRWNITYEDGREEKYVDISKFRLPHTVKRGEKVLFENLVPEINQDRVDYAIYTEASAIRVFIDEKEVYASQFDRIEEGLQPGIGYHVISIPREDALTPIRLEVTAGAYDAFSMFQPPQIHHSMMARTDMANAELARLCICAFLTIMGITVMLLGLINTGVRHRGLWYCLLGLYISGLGLYSVYFSDVIDIFSSDIGTNSVLRFLIMMLLPLPMIGLVGNIAKTITGLPKWVSRGFTISSIVLGCWIIVASILHLTGVAFYVSTQSVFDVLMGVVLFFLMFILIRRPGETFDPVEKVMFYSLAGMGIVSVGDFLFFYIIKMFSISTMHVTISIMPFGALVMVIVNMVGYLMHSFNESERRAREVVLQRQHELDAVTGCLNRRYGIQLIKKKLEEKNFFEMLLFHVDNMPEIYEEKGEVTYYDMAKEFVAVLAQNYRDTSEPIRYGVDTFVVINDLGRKHYIKAFNKVKKMIDSIGKVYGKELSISYGAANSEEIKHKNIDSLFDLSEKRMEKMMNITHEMHNS